MEELEIEIVVINGKKHPYCSKLILYIHLILAMMVSIFSSYYLNFVLNDGESLSQQIGNSMSIVTDSVLNLGKDLASQKRSIEYHANILNQFVENGYEVYMEQIPLNDWWAKQESTTSYKIFFQRDYSSRPQLFFGISQVKYFTVPPDSKSDEVRNVVVSVALKEVMTSYFSVDIKIACNAAIEATDAMKDTPPIIFITYVLLNRRE
jgi:hypothetical protein